MEAHFSRDPLSRPGAPEELRSRLRAGEPWSPAPRGMRGPPPPCLAPCPGTSSWHPPRAGERSPGVGSGLLSRTAVPSEPSPDARSPQSLRTGPHVEWTRAWLGQEESSRTRGPKDNGWCHWRRDIGRHPGIRPRDNRGQAWTSQGWPGAGPGSSPPAASACAYLEGYSAPQNWGRVNPCVSSHQSVGLCYGGHKTQL